MVTFCVLKHFFVVNNFVINDNAVEYTTVYRGGSREGGAPPPLKLEKI
jgi:hypothetical protein